MTFMKYMLSILFTLLLTAQTLFSGEQVTFYHTDHVGTPLAITDSTGAVVWQADYKPFGEEHTVTNNAGNNKRFVGKEKDTESGFSYFDARYEDAKTGRFISVDPVGAVNPQNSKTNEELLGNPKRLNSYAYGLNNPYRFVDEDGKSPRHIDAGIKILSRLPVVGPQVARLNDASDKMARRFNGQISQLTDETANLASTVVQKNFDRFLKKIPANSKSSAMIESIENGGYRFSATSAGEVPGAKAIYEKFVDIAGKTTGYIKTTIDPKGQIVHIKDKMGQ